MFGLSDAQQLDLLLAGSVFAIALSIVFAFGFAVFVYIDAKRHSERKGENPQ